MVRINLLEKEQTSQKAQEVLNGIEQKMGKIINIFKVMANSSAVLKTYLGIDNALKEKTLDSAIAERIAILMSVINGCEYCLAAHSFLASKILSQDEILSSREGKSADEKAQIALDFAASVMKNAGRVSDDELQKIKDADFSDGEILEIVAIVSLNFFTNAINNVAQTKLDFPKVK